MNANHLDLPVRHCAVGPDTFPFIEAGTGSPVLFLHGALGDRRTFGPHAAILSRRFRCLSPTQRHFGDAAWRADGPRFGVATHARDLAAFLDALGLGPVDVVAWSYAGHVALEAALSRPDLFRRILAYEPGVRTIPLPPEELARFGEDAQAMFGPIFEAVSQGALEESVRRLIDASGGPGHFDARPEKRRRILLENAHTMPLLLAQEEPPATACEALRGLPMPVTVAWGERTRPVFKVPAQAVARCIGKGRGIEVPGVGHLWPDDDPQAFSAFVEGWLDDRL
ncbi:alpha/beta fold hydrolase [Microvirga thermotolerans]|uniref:Alpha/beta fold hydrolase n=1 Tax=Microvirga thermotolerans TaxID=2651334 RepID=A0A5P9JV89_9HYPH|nr:alpha/beta hydrolase [Microvirga thermotolerans]QFU16353.1 alpha/beta fold hydrolase [Microvirga thermotolerans]